MKFEIENLTNEMCNGIDQAISATSILSDEFGVEPAFQVKIILMTLMGALNENDVEELFGVVKGFLDKKMNEILNQDTDTAIQDLISGINGINLN